MDAGPVQPAKASQRKGERRCKERQYSLTATKGQTLMLLALNRIAAADPNLISLSSLIARGRHAEAESLAQKQARRLPLAQRSCLLTLRSEIALGLGRFASALEWACDALKIAEVGGDIAREVERLRVRALLGLGRLREAEARIEARLHARETEAAELSYVRAHIALRRGLLVEAKRQAGLAIGVAIKARQRPALVEALLLKARIEREQGNPALAKHDLDRAHRLSNGLRNPSHLAEVLADRADLLAHSGEWRAAATDASQSGRLFARVFSPHEHLTAGRRTGLVDLAQGDPGSALRPIQRAADISGRGFGTPEGRAEIDLLLADAQLAEQDSEGALERATSALSLFQASGDPGGRVRAHVRRSLAALSAANPALALREARRAVSIQGAGPVATGLADLALGRVLLRQDPCRAVEPFERALRNPSLYPPLHAVAHLGVAIGSGAGAQSDSVRRHLDTIEAFGDRRILCIVRSDLRELLGIHHAEPSTLVAVVPAPEEGNPFEETSEFLPGLVGSSDAVKRLASLVTRAAPSDLPISIYGETGTGKEKIARAIHDLSPRAGRKFVAINAAVLSDELFESEIFGHVRGSFTGAQSDRPGLIEEAKGGTLFIDEVAELSPRSQARLLRVLQDGAYRRVGENHERRADVRLVVAANQRLQDLVAAGRFRLDLMYRLQGLDLTVPALRERGRDVLRLARHFARGFSGGARRLSACSEQELVAYDWPGNVRELEQEMRRAVILADTEVVDWHAPDRTPAPKGSKATNASAAHADAGPSPEPSLKEAVAGFERTLLMTALESGSERAAVARSLGISRQALHQKMARHGL